MEMILFYEVIYTMVKITYSTWAVPYGIFFKIYNFIPVSDDEIEGAIVSWVKMKFKSQGTSFDDELNRFIYN